jgi:hypothetical protein
MKRLLALALLAGCAQQQQQAPAPQPALERSCAILVGGNGPGFADPRIDRFWRTVNLEVTKRLQARLFEKYRAEPLMIDIQERSRTHELVGTAMARHGCNRILQVVHDVNADAQGSYFAFIVSMLGVTPTAKTEGGTVVTTRGVFEKRYRYARTREVMDTLSMSDVGDRMFTDLEASGALEGIRR